MASRDIDSIRKAKANTACNTCRARKTRCDGERPSCSYCRTTGGQCVYRTTAPEHPPSLNEQAILERLDNLEARLRAVSHLNEDWIRSQQSPPHAEPLVSGRPPNKSLYVQTPFFHTAASHKMLHYWPRINMSITLDGVNPLRYVEDTGNGGVPPHMAMAMMDGPAEVDAAAVEGYLAHIQENCTGIDLLLSQLIQRHSNVMSAFLLQASPPSGTPQSVASYLSGGRQLSLRTCHCQLLLTIALAARAAYQKSCHDMADMIAKDVEKQSFQIAYMKIGELLFTPDDDSIPFLMLGAHLLMSEACPVGALRLIQAAGDRLGRCGRRQVNEPWWIERFQDCLKLHHVIESDILLTMDGLPSDTAFSLMNSLPAMKSLREAETGYSNMSVAEIAKKKFGETLFEGVLALSNIQNRILAQMYTIEQAYSQPSVLAKSVTDLKAELTHWFDKLPLEWHFPRDLSGAMTIPNPSPDLLGYLRLKYYVLEFLMCRPILYYIAHESFEAPMDHPSVSIDGRSSDSEGGQPFWVYDACHRCLQCAALIILGNDTSGWTQEHAAARRDWFELHMIWGAALTLTLALATPALTRFLPKHGQLMDASILVAKAEAILLEAAKENSVPAQCLAILCNIEESLLGGSHSGLVPAPNATAPQT